MVTGCSHPATGDKYIPYGATGWTPLVGDWNGDGKSEIGIYKDAVWYLDYGGSGVIDANTRYYQFGAAGWTPLIGDWNGDKKDEIGIYKDGNWYLDYDGNGFWRCRRQILWIRYQRVDTRCTGNGPVTVYTKIGIYNGGNWYIDYNGDGHVLPEVTSIFPTERPDGHTSSGTGMEIGRVRSEYSRTEYGTLTMMAAGPLMPTQNITRSVKQAGHHCREMALIHQQSVHFLTKSMFSDIFYRTLISFSRLKVPVRNYYVANSHTLLIPDP